MIPVHHERRSKSYQLVPPTGTDPSFPFSDQSTPQTILQVNNAALMQIYISDHNLFLSLDLPQLPAMVNYSMKGRTYRYLNGPTLYSFGYGLSYTNFKYKAMSLAPKVKAGEDIHVDLSVANTGSVDSDEVSSCHQTVYFSFIHNYIYIYIII